MTDAGDTKTFTLDPQQNLSQYSPLPALYDVATVPFRLFTPVGAKKLSVSIFEHDLGGSKTTAYDFAVDYITASVKSKAPMAIIAINQIYSGSRPPATWGEPFATSAPKSLYIAYVIDTSLWGCADEMNNICGLMGYKDPDYSSSDWQKDGACVEPTTSSASKAASSLSRGEMTYDQCTMESVGTCQYSNDGGQTWKNEGMTMACCASGSRCGKGAVNYSGETCTALTCGPASDFCQCPGLNPDLLCAANLVPSVCDQYGGTFYSFRPNADDATGYVWITNEPKAGDKSHKK